MGMNMVSENLPLMDSRTKVALAPSKEVIGEGNSGAIFNKEKFVLDGISFSDGLKLVTPSLSGSGEKHNLENSDRPFYHVIEPSEVEMCSSFVVHQASCLSLDCSVSTSSSSPAAREAVSSLHSLRAIKPSAPRPRVKGKEGVGNLCQLNADVHYEGDCTQACEHGSDRDIKIQSVDIFSQAWRIL
ncbi:hypothetical protein LguiB_028301 [Lonicera macranthoides]